MLLRIAHQHSERHYNIHFRKPCKKSYKIKFQKQAFSYSLRTGKTEIPFRKKLKFPSGAKNKSVSRPNLQSSSRNAWMKPKKKVSLYFYWEKITQKRLQKAFKTWLGVFNFSRNGNATIPNALKLNVSVVLYVNCATVAIFKTIRNYLKDSCF